MWIGDDMLFYLARMESMVFLVSDWDNGGYIGSDRPRAAGRVKP
jgi:hypothetical protein